METNAPEAQPSPQATAGGFPHTSALLLPFLPLQAPSGAHDQLGDAAYGLHPPGQQAEGMQA